MAVFARAGSPCYDESHPFVNNQLNEWVCKPSSVSRPIRTGSGHLSGPTVTSRLKRPTCWQSPPVSGLTLGPSNQLLGLAGGGVYPAGDVTIAAVRSYRTISPLLVPIARDVSRVFSVALSLGSPPVAVSHHRALPCPDFPPPLLRFCLPLRLSTQDEAAGEAKRRGRPPDPLI